MVMSMCPGFFLASTLKVCSFSSCMPLSFNLSLAKVSRIFIFLIASSVSAAGMPLPAREDSSQVPSNSLLPTGGGSGSSAAHRGATASSRAKVNRGRIWAPFTGRSLLLFLELKQEYFDRLEARLPRVAGTDGNGDR